MATGLVFATCAVQSHCQLTSICSRPRSEGCSWWPHASLCWPPHAQAPAEHLCARCRTPSRCSTHNMGCLSPASFAAASLRFSLWPLDRGGPLGSVLGPHPCACHLPSLLQRLQGPVTFKSHPRAGERRVSLGIKCPSPSPAAQHLHWTHQAPRAHPS